MTKQQFDEAVERLQVLWPPLKNKTEVDVRVVVAACLVMRQRRGIPADQPWGGPTDAELAEFLAGLDRVRRKRLKLQVEALSMDEYLAETGQADRSVH
jgi:hypothetical protein